MQWTSGIVDLEIGEMLDAAFAHVGQGAALVHGAEAAAVAVGGEGQGIFFRQQQFSVHREGGHHSLLEEEDGVLGVAEEFVLVEKRAGRHVVVVAGHDVPGNRLARLAAVSQKLLGENLEKRLILDRRDGVFPLGAVVTEAGSLAAGDEKRADFSSREKFMSAALRFLVHRLAGSVSQSADKPAPAQCSWGERAWAYS